VDDPQRAEVLETGKRISSIVEVRLDQVVLPLRETKRRARGVEQQGPANTREEGDEILLCLNLAQRPLIIVVRDHHPAAGLRAGAARRIRLLKHDYRCSEVGAVDRCGVTCDARPDYDYVGGCVPIVIFLKADDRRIRVNESGICHVWSPRGLNYV
jgi:hypothetical protein